MMINELKPNQIFVFGSNLAGSHGGGAAAQAHTQFGAEWGKGEGLTGQCYAFPTLARDFSKVSDSQLEESRDRMYEAAEANPDKEFLLTKVGCGIAGFPEEKMKELFRNAPKNVIKPEDWKYPEVNGDGIIGAIIGDIVGSIYEFDNIKTKDFPLFGADCEFTDDSIMTIATMQALLEGGTESDFIHTYQELGNKYPSSYGSRFQDWLIAKDPKPYNSWGNGSAMRVSPAAWFYDDLPTVERIAAVSASVTHNHPEGIKGAQATAAAVFMARTGSSKSEIKHYAGSKYDYLLDFTLDDIRPHYDFDESSQGSVPPAIVAFLESTDFEDAIRNAISLGGDSDTLAAITGSIAGAFYGVPSDIGNKAMTYLPDELATIVSRFNDRITGR